MDFSHLEYFRVVARYGNLSRAAKDLYISQPGLSRYISRLEEEVGVPLFDRRKGKVVLNPYGQIFLTNVNLAFEHLEQGVETIRQLYSRDQNILSVACSIEDFLIDRLKDFSPLYPEIGIRQFSYSPSEMEAQLLRNNLDLAICANPPRNDKIKYDRLSSCPYVLICHEDNPLTAEKSIYLNQASHQRFICESSRLNRRGLERLCREVGFTPHVTHEIENSYILVNLLASNVGVALVPLAYSPKIDMQFPGHRLKILPLRDDDLPLSEIGMAYPEKRSLSSSAQCFVEYLRSWTTEEQIRLLELERSIPR